MSDQSVDPDLTEFPQMPLSMLDEIRERQDSFYPVEESAILKSSEGFRLGHLTSMLLITADPDPDSEERTENDDIKAAAKRPARTSTIGVELASFLAWQDFNQRDSSVVPSLSSIISDHCPDLYFTVDLRDTRGSPSHGVRQFQKLAAGSSRTTGIVGSGRSSVTIPGSTLSSVYGIPQVSCCATSRALTPSHQPFFGRTVPTNRQDAVAAVAWFASLRVPLVGMLHVQGAYGQEFAADFQNEIQNRNRGLPEDARMAPVIASFDGDDPESIRRAIMRIKDSEVKYIFAVFYQEYLDIVMELAYDCGIIGPDYFWMLGEGLARVNNEAFFTTNPKIAAALDGTGLMLLHVPPNPDYDKCLSDFKQNNATQEYFVSRHTEPDIFDSFNFQEIPSLFWSQLNYDASMSLLLATCLAPQEYPTGPEIYATMKMIEFRGASGIVRFDQDTGTRTSEGLLYSVFNLIPRAPDADGAIYFDAPVSAEIDFLATEVVRFREPYVFAGQSHVAPLPLPPLEEDLNLINDLVRIAGLVLCSAVLAMSLGWAIWTFTYRRRVAVRSSQPLFLGMLCSGSFIMGLSIIPMSFQEPLPKNVLDAGCMSIVWLQSIGFTTAFSALFSKLYRINRLHTAAVTFRRVRVRPRDAVLPFIVLISLNLVVLGAWTSSYPLVWVRRDYVSIKDRFGRHTDSYGVCHSKDLEEGQPFLWALVVINMFSLLVAVHQSYRSRSLPSDYNETPYIAVSFLSMLETSIVGIPLIWVTYSSPSESFLIRSILVSAVCCAILLPTFVPKVRLQRRLTRQRHHQYVRQNCMHSSIAKHAELMSEEHDPPGDGGLLFRSVVSQIPSGTPSEASQPEFA